TVTGVQTCALPIYRVQPDELAGHLADRAADACGGAGPVARAEPVKPRLFAAHVPRDHADLVARHVQLVALCVLQQEVVPLGPTDLTPDHARVPADAVHLVHRKLAGDQLHGQRVVAV